MKAIPGWVAIIGRIVSAAVIVAVGVNSDGRREVLGMDIGPSEAETFWTASNGVERQRCLSRGQPRPVLRPHCPVIGLAKISGFIAEFSGVGMVSEGSSDGQEPIYYLN